MQKLMRKIRIYGKVNSIGVGDGGARGPQNSGKNFFGQLLCKSMAFFGQKSCEIPEFC